MGSSRHLTYELPVNPDARHRRLSRPIEKSCLDVLAKLTHDVQLQGLVFDRLALEELLDALAVGTVGLGEDGDGVGGDHVVDDLVRGVLRPVPVTQRAHPTGFKLVLF